MLHVVALAAALMAPPPSTAVNTVPNVRTHNPFLASLIADSVRVSPTLAAMIDRVEQSDVIIFFEAVPRFDSNLRGCLHFMGAAGNYRYLRAQIKTMMTRFDIVASLAHELQHAIEIAEHPDVRSEADLEELYRRIGHERQARRFETDEAQSVGRTVRAEMLGAL
jgi:hypothetical protein